MKPQAKSLQNKCGPMYSAMLRWEESQWGSFVEFYSQQQVLICLWRCFDLFHLTCWSILSIQCFGIHFVPNFVNTAPSSLIKVKSMIYTFSLWLSCYHCVFSTANEGDEPFVEGRHPRRHAEQDQWLAVWHRTSDCVYSTFHDLKPALLNKREQARRKAFWALCYLLHDTVFCLIWAQKWQAETKCISTKNPSL